MQVYKRLVTAVNDVEKRLPFSLHNRLGFLTFCPTNLGTTIRASVHIKLPKLAADKAKLEEISGKYNLQVFNNTKDNSFNLQSNNHVILILYKTDIECFYFTTQSGF